MCLFVCLFSTRMFILPHEQKNRNKLQSVLLFEGLKKDHVGMVSCYKCSKLLLIIWALVCFLFPLTSQIMRQLIMQMKSGRLGHTGPANVDKSKLSLGKKRLFFLQKGPLQKAKKNAFSFSSSLSERSTKAASG